MEFSACARACTRILLYLTIIFRAHLIVSYPYIYRSSTLPTWIRDDGIYYTRICVCKCSTCSGKKTHHSYNYATCKIDIILALFFSNRIEIAPDCSEIPLKVHRDVSKHAATFIAPPLLLRRKIHHKKNLVKIVVNP